jgi:prepilin-type N-terminal cleavage/methylation domain-containing protein/prepilin-type processing-associated H-X9-DG protein
MSNRRDRNSGFTLVELIVVVGVIALLVSILLPAVGKARESGRRAVCTSNLKQLATACTLYSSNDERGVFVWEANYSSDDFSIFYPKYLPNPQVTICPSTDNVVRNLPADLKHVAASVSDSSGGHSYEVLGYYINGTYPDGKVITTDELKRAGNTKYPSRVIMFWDADEAGLSNWPDAQNNHGTAGTNLGFADGHAEWTPPGRLLLEHYMNSYMSKTPGAATCAQYGLKQNGNVFSW